MTLPEVEAIFAVEGLYFTPELREKLAAYSKVQQEAYAARVAALTKK